MNARWLSIVALCACIGVPASVAVSADCRKAVFDSVWAKKVRDIADFNHAHPGYVAKHRLDRDMARETAALKARMRKLLDGDSLTCGIDAIASSPEFVVRAEEISVDPLSSAVGATPAFELVPSALSTAIAQQEPAGYDNPEHDYLGDAIGNPGGWLGGGGWLLNPVLGGQPPVRPIKPTAPTPEPSSLLLLSMGLVGIAFKIRRRG